MSEVASSLASSSASPLVSPPPTRHYGVLDGWRAVSIALVLCGHLLPLGPSRLRLNEAIAAAGMVLFFILSGFLITSFLLRQDDVRVFLIRRFCRIVPLAWLFSVIVLAWTAASLPTWAASLLFYANLPPFWLIPATAHLWSLCLEVQFYAGVALLVGVAGRRGLWALPVLCVAVTGLRIATETHVSIVSWVRLDEILAGSILALLFHRWPATDAAKVPALAWVPLGALLVASAHPYGGALNYLRPYVAASLVGLTLYAPRSAIGRLLQRPSLFYVASISYALYVIHGGLVNSWLGSGDTMVKYLKRPLLFAVLFGLAHLSTFHFESRWIAFGQRLSRRVGRPARTAEALR